jgi:wyosine [tRNA(Phe)-imidazoG37] synthetase (radical SAM superfamily)
VIAFGPVPSRRLGRSLGINNIPPKVCTYSCVYCQLGRTIQMRANRRSFYKPGEIEKAVREKVASAVVAGEPVDYLTFVPDGEPTLDAHLSRALERLKPLGIKIAVITNGSLIWHQDVRAALMGADWVSLKVDAVREEVWRRVDRPHGALRLAAILEGMLDFSHAYQGELAAETMLVAGVNDSADQVREVADFLAGLQPAVAYLAIPTRPPAEEWVRPPGEAAINRAYQVLGEKLQRVEYLIGYEGNAFALTGNVEEDLLSITAVHPMREDAVGELLARAGVDWSTAHRLVAQRQLIVVTYEGHRFYMRTPSPTWKCGRPSPEC